MKYLRLFETFRKDVKEDIEAALQSFCDEYQLELEYGKSWFEVYEYRYNPSVGKVEEPIVVSCEKFVKDIDRLISKLELCHNFTPNDDLILQFFVNNEDTEDNLRYNLILNHVLYNKFKRELSEYEHSEIDLVKVCIKIHF